VTFCLGEYGLKDLRLTFFLLLLGLGMSNLVGDPTGLKGKELGSWVRASVLWTFEMIRQQVK
jgi:hypothetical protein